MRNDGVRIKGKRDGLIAEVDSDRFGSFEDMLETLTLKLSKGKKFYKGTSLYISTKLSNFNEKEILKLKDTLIEEIEVKEIIFEDSDLQKEEQEDDNKGFSGVHEGKTKFIRKTIRSGQRINYQGNIVIIGDVNSGAEVYATGNIIVLGTIKGNVFAGTTGNEEAIIAAYSLQPGVLKIGNIITVSPDDYEKPEYPEIAKVNDGTIIVEPYISNKYF
ncbi:MAG: septum site-determining protein MinC [Clostridium sp.]|nr:septum site-determining protein MinC [Clostridium sp.]MCI7443410.1 septum site-determining protein MinC [Clostridium sp.]